MRYYYTHDNGGRPFKIAVEKGVIQVYRALRQNPDTYEYEYGDEPILKLSDYNKLFIGYDDQDPHGQFAGNSVLVHTKDHEYVFIGHEIYSFDTPSDTINDYVSPVGNSDMPYPFAVGDRYCYLMLDNVYLPNKLLEGYKFDGIDYPYQAYYGYELQGNNKNPFLYVAQHIKKNILHRRLR